jgi:hypothetical protein
MTVSVTKISCIVLFCVGMLFQYCDNPTGADDTNPKRFDGITSATGSYFRIDSVRVTSVSADLYWWDHWDDGDTQMVRWGLDKNYSSGSINLQLLPITIETTTKTIIGPLLPGTHYYVQFLRVYENSHKGCVAIDFTTPTLVLP